MAKVTNPLMSQDARGSVSGIQYSRNRSGNFGSRKSTSNRSQSLTVTAHRSRIKFAHTLWDGLDADYQALWNAYMGPVRTGRNGYVGAAIRSLMSGQATPSKSPLESPSAPHVYDLTAQLSEFPPNRLDFAWDGEFPGDNRYLFYVAFPRGPSLVHVRKYRFIGSANPFSSSFQFPLAYNPPFAAVRFLNYDYARGLIAEEFRAVLIGHAITRMTDPEP